MSAVVELGANCTSGCRTKDHATWGECMRAKNTRVGWAASASGRDLTTQRKWDSRLKEYRAARRQGIMPASTKLRDIRKAVEISNKTGVPFKGANS